MRIIGVLRTSDYRGDHSTDIAVPFEPTHNESLRAFVYRVMNYTPIGASESIAKPERGDHIELFVVQEPKRT